MLGETLMIRTLSDRRRLMAGHLEALILRLAQLLIRRLGIRQGS